MHRISFSHMHNYWNKNVQNCSGASELAQCLFGQLFCQLLRWAWKRLAARRRRSFSKICSTAGLTIAYDWTYKHSFLLLKSVSKIDQPWVSDHGRAAARHFKRKFRLFERKGPRILKQRSRNSKRSPARSERRCPSTQRFCWGRASDSEELSVVWELSTITECSFKNT